MGQKRIEAIAQQWLKKSQENWLLDSLREGDTLKEDLATFLRENTPEQIGQKIGDQIDPTYESLRRGLIDNDAIIIFVSPGENIELFGRVTKIDFGSEGETGTNFVSVTVDSLDRGATQKTETFKITAGDQVDRLLYKIEEDALFDAILDA